MENFIYSSPSPFQSLPPEVRSNLAKPLASICASCSQEQFEEIIIRNDRGIASTLDVLASCVSPPADKNISTLLSQVVSSYRRIVSFYLTEKTQQQEQQEEEEEQEEMKSKNSKKKKSEKKVKLLMNPISSLHEIFRRIALDLCNLIACIEHPVLATNLAQVAQAAVAARNAKQQQQQQGSQNTGVASPSSPTSTTTKPGAAAGSINSKLRSAVSTIVSSSSNFNVASKSDLNTRALDLLCNILLVVVESKTSSTEQEEEKENERERERKREGARLPASHTNDILVRLAHLVNQLERSQDRIQTFSVLMYCLAGCGNAAESSCWKRCVRIIRNGKTSSSSSSSSKVVIKDFSSKPKPSILIRSWHSATICFAREFSKATTTTTISSSSKENNNTSNKIPINWVETNTAVALPNLGAAWIARSFALILSFFTPDCNADCAIPIASVYSDVATTLRCSSIDAPTALLWFGNPVVVANQNQNQINNNNDSSSKQQQQQEPNFDLAMTCLETISTLGRRREAEQDDSTILSWKILTRKTLATILTEEEIKSIEDELGESTNDSKNTQQQHHGDGNDDDDDDFLPPVATSPTKTINAPTSTSPQFSSNNSNNNSPPISLPKATRFLKNFECVAIDCANRLTWAHLYQRAVLKVVPKIIELTQQQQQQQQPSSSSSTTTPTPNIIIPERTWASIAHHLSVAASSNSKILWNSWQPIKVLQTYICSELGKDSPKSATVTSVVVSVLHARSPLETSLEMTRVLCSFANDVFYTLKERLTVVAAGITTTTTVADSSSSGSNASSAQQAQQHRKQRNLRGVVAVLQCISMFPWDCCCSSSSSSSSHTSSSSKEEMQKLLQETIQLLGLLADNLASYVNDQEMLHGSSSVMDTSRMTSSSSSPGGNTKSGGVGNKNENEPSSSLNFDGDIVADASSPSSASLLVVYYWIVKLTSRISSLLPNSVVVNSNNNATSSSSSNANKNNNINSCLETCSRIATHGLSLPVNCDTYFCRLAAVELFFQTIVGFKNTQLPEVFPDESALLKEAARITVFSVGTDRIISLVQLSKNSTTSTSTSKNPSSASTGVDETDDARIAAFIRTPFGRCAFRFARLPPSWSSVLSQTSTSTTTTTTTASGGENSSSSSTTQQQSSSNTTSSSRVSNVIPKVDPLRWKNDEDFFGFESNNNNDNKNTNTNSFTPLSSRKVDLSDTPKRRVVEDRFPLLRVLAREFTLQASNWKLLAFNPSLVAHLKGLDRSISELDVLDISVHLFQHGFPCSQNDNSQRTKFEDDLYFAQERFEVFFKNIGSPINSSKNSSSFTKQQQEQENRRVTTAEFRSEKRGVVLSFGVQSVSGEKVINNNSIPCKDDDSPPRIILNFGLPAAAQEAAFTTSNNNNSTTGSNNSSSSSTSTEQQHMMQAAARRFSLTPGSPLVNSTPATTNNKNSSNNKRPYGILPLQIDVAPIQGSQLFFVKSNSSGISCARIVGSTGSVMELEACVRYVRELCFVYFTSYLQPTQLLTRREALRRVIEVADPFRECAPLPASTANVICELMRQNDIQVY